MEPPPARGFERPDLSPVSFAVVGDSITEWTTLEPEHSSWVASAHSARVLLAGGWAVSGATTSDMLAHIDAVPAADVLVVMAGTNDFLDVYPDWTLQGSLERILRIVEETGIDTVVLSAIAPNDHRTARTLEFNVALEALAAQEGWTWIDPWSFVRATDGTFLPGTSTDGIHPTNQVEQRIGVELRSAILHAARD